MDAELGATGWEWREEEGTKKENTAGTRSYFKLRRKLECDLYKKKTYELTEVLHIFKQKHQLLSKLPQISFSFSRWLFPLNLCLSPLFASLEADVDLNNVTPSVSIFHPQEHKYVNVPARTHTHIHTPQLHQRLLKYLTSRRNDVSKLFTPLPLTLLLAAKSHTPPVGPAQPWAPVSGLDIPLGECTDWCSR